MRRQNSVKLKSNTDKINIGDLYNQFGTNSVSARERYDNTLIQISGVILQINRDHLGALYVMVQDQHKTGYQSARKYNSIQCFVMQKDIREIESSYQRGDSITLQGKIDIYQSLYDFIVLQECQII